MAARLVLGLSPRLLESKFRGFFNRDVRVFLRFSYATAYTRGPINLSRGKSVRLKGVTWK